MVTASGAADLPPADVYARACPCRQLLDRIADKWTALIIGRLEIAPHRFNELRRAVDGVSQKMLTQTLRSLERDGMVTRTVIPTVPVTVEYALTDLGRSLSPALAMLRGWSQDHRDEVERAHAVYDARDIERLQLDDDLADRATALDLRMGGSNGLG